MLLFIYSLIEEMVGDIRFNTSHVVVYQDNPKGTYILAMFQYISCCCLSVKVLEEHDKNDLFQYISCCCLSVPGVHCTKPTPFQYISCCCLSYNTRSQNNYFDMFQYISCCCLSARVYIRSHTNTPFQYISCCCLSAPASYFVFPIVKFQYISCCCLSARTHCQSWMKLVSIHLMLLFINF